MSYYTIYDRRFIKTTRGIIAMVLSADSSVSQTTADAQGRRITVPVKHWDVYNQHLIELPEYKIREWAENTYANLGEYEMLRWRSSWVLGNQMTKWFQQGCKNARTLEEYIQANWHLALECKVCIWEDTSTMHTTTMTTCCRTTSDLEQWIDQARQKISAVKEENPAAECYMSFSFNSDKPLKSYHVTKGSVVVKDGDRFLTDCITDKEFHFSKEATEAMVFESVEAAQKAIGNHWIMNLRFVQAKSQMRERKYILKATAGRLADHYITERTTTSLKATLDKEAAKHFTSRYDAVRFTTRLRKHGFSESKTGKFILCNLSNGTEELLDV